MINTYYFWIIYLLFHIIHHRGVATKILKILRGEWKQTVQIAYFFDIITPSCLCFWTWLLSYVVQIQVATMKFLREMNTKKSLRIPCSLFLYIHLFPSSVSSLSLPKAVFTNPLTKDEARFCLALSILTELDENGSKKQEKMKREYYVLHQCF